MRIALVNDVKIAVEALRRVVTSLPSLKIAWIAEDGKQAVEKCRVDRPDVILMDLIMPVMDGVEATRQIMQQCPCPILVVTATVTGNAGKVYEALGHGAVDAVNTPVLGSGGNLSGGDDLLRKIRCVGRLHCNEVAESDRAVAQVPAAAAPPTHRTPPLVVIGSSTGGPQALAKVLAGMSQPLACSIVVVQHLDQSFVAGLANWLHAETGLDVQLVQPGQPPKVGTVHLADTTNHLVMDAQGRLDNVAEPAAAFYRPSVNVFFESLLSAPAKPGVAVLLTGMGRDGARGLKGLREAGWTTIAQDEATSIVWGMPGAAVTAGAANYVLPVDQIGAAVTRLSRNVSAVQDS